MVNSINLINDLHGVYMDRKNNYEIFDNRQLMIAEQIQKAKSSPSTAAGAAPPAIMWPFDDKSTADIADVPLPNNTPSAVNVVAPVPPCATGNAVSKVNEDSSAAEPLVIIFFHAKNIRR